MVTTADTLQTNKTTNTSDIIITDNTTGLYWDTSATASFDVGSIEANIYIRQNRKGISPILYFKYLKKKFKYLERRKLDLRLERIKAAYYKALESGQEALSKKLLNETAVEVRESVIYAKGIKKYLELSDVNKHKNSIKDGRISDTKLEAFTRDIPLKVIKKKKAVEDLFDGFVIYHYWKEDQENNKEMDPDEKSKMRDPVLFGTIKESKRLYFIADWEDEYCDLSFEDMAQAAGKEVIEKEPELAKKYLKK